jgi:hypothetical protein
MLQSSDDETAVTDSPTEEQAAVEQAPEEQATEATRFRRLRRRTLLLQELGRLIEERRSHVKQAMAEVAE